MRGRHWGGRGVRARSRRLPIALARRSCGRVCLPVLARDSRVPFLSYWILYVRVVVVRALGTAAGRTTATGRFRVLLCQPPLASRASALCSAEGR